ncbi:MAG: DUF1499 domain-containing protein [Myxacorys californica WJT36-NPBG1]|jgi:uncharacterized protein (DUF1499 family)|nr:DUF1499 domain-containing protein [Myxacorys californica WJT36-NPBG1]
MFAGKQPTTLGVRDGRLAPCPATPNCVCSQDSDPGHSIEPLKLSSPDSAIADLKRIIQALPKTKIVEESNDYLYAQFTSKLMGYVDDVEFYVDRAANVIHVRSASRLGKSDLGVNRKRIELIRTQLA